MFFSNNSNSNRDTIYFYNLNHLENATVKPSQNDQTLNQPNNRTHANATRSI